MNNILGISLRVGFALLCLAVGCTQQESVGVTAQMLREDLLPMEQDKVREAEGLQNPAARIEQLSRLVNEIVAERVAQDRLDSTESVDPATDHGWVRAAIFANSSEDFVALREVEPAPRAPESLRRHVARQSTVEEFARANEEAIRAAGFSETEMAIQLQQMRQALGVTAQREGGVTE